MLSMNRGRCPRANGSFGWLMLYGSAGASGRQAQAAGKLQGRCEVVGLSVNGMATASEVAPAVSCVTFTFHCLLTSPFPLLLHA